MLHISHTSRSSSGELFDNVLDTVEFYGYAPLGRTLKERKPQRALKPRGTANLYSTHERKLGSLTKALVAHGMHRASVPECSYQLDTKNSKIASLNLHISGSRSPIAEGMLLATLASIARENGMTQFIVHINSLGDKESSARYMRELTNFLRARINDLPPYARDEMQAGHVMRAFSRLVEKEHECVSSAPNPMEYLNDESRSHLHDVLEYTEHMGIPYELDPALVGSSDCWHHTIFELRTTDEHGNSVVVAHGGRHDALAKKAFRVELPIVSAIIEHEVIGRTKPRHRKEMQPKFFFAQLGPRAKMKSFVVLNHLKDAGVPISHQIALESIGGQLVHAERDSIPYVVLVGHKEALDDTAIVRNMHTRSQVVVPLAKLSGYLKRLKV